jgi:hypothetical protein
MDPVRVARVADEADRLPRLDPGAVDEVGRVGGAGHARALVVVARAEVVVEVDVEVGRAAVAVQVEHAAGVRGGRPELDRAGLGGEGERLPRRHDVVPLVPAAGARVAEVVRVADGAEHREDDRRLRSRPGGGRDRGCGAEKEENGEPDHVTRFAVEPGNPSGNVGRAQICAAG